MAEQVYGQIEIPVKYIDDEVKRVVEEEIFRADKIDWNNYTCRECDLEVHEKEGIVYIANSMADNGRMEEIEGVLVNKKIPFDAYSSSDFEFPATRIYYRPGSDNEKPIHHEEELSQGAEEEFVTKHDLKQLFSLDPKRAMEELKELLGPKISSLKDWAT